MKTRLGFVSNSSSSSFVLTETSVEQVKQYIEKLLEAENFINDTDFQMQDICDIYEIDDVAQFRYDAFLYYNYNSSITYDEFKKLRDIYEKISGVVVDSTNDNSIPTVIQDALQRIGERYHWG